MINRQNEWKTIVTIHNPERAAFWREAIGTATLPVISFIPSVANLPGHDNARIYMLDLQVISMEMKAAIIKGIAQKFNLDPDFVASNINEIGVPILADDCSVISTDQDVRVRTTC